MSKNWDYYKIEFKNHLKLERGLSSASVEAYNADVEKLEAFLSISSGKKVSEVRREDILALIGYLVDLGVSHRTQARLISGLKSFFNFLVDDGDVNENPLELIESPKLPRNIPDTLSFEEIEEVLGIIDLSTPQGFRNRSILETLYSSGLRVTELLTLRKSFCFLDEGYIKVTGKGDKERLVPIGQDASKYLYIYLNEVRVHLDIKPGFEDVVYLNRRGRSLTRQMIFHVVKEAVSLTGIKKVVSPHTFRHSFATHLVEGGADLRAVQQMLGHESITTTEIYTHLDKNYLRQTILDYHPRS